MIYLPQDDELENDEPENNELEDIVGAIKAIGPSELSLKKALVRGIQKALIENGYDAAIVYTEQYFLSTDLNAELVRVLMICRRYGLSPKAASQALDKLIAGSESS